MANIVFKIECKLAGVPTAPTSGSLSLSYVVDGASQTATGITAAMIRTQRTDLIPGKFVSLGANVAVTCPTTSSFTVCGDIDFANQSIGPIAVTANTLRAAATLLTITITQVPMAGQREIQQIVLNAPVISGSPVLGNGADSATLGTPLISSEFVTGFRSMASIGSSGCVDSAESPTNTFKPRFADFLGDLPKSTLDLTGCTQAVTGTVTQTRAAADSAELDVTPSMTPTAPDNSAILSFDHVPVSGTIFVNVSGFAISGFVPGDPDGSLFASAMSDANGGGHFLATGNWTDGFTITDLTGGVDPVPTIILSSLKYNTAAVAQQLTLNLVDATVGGITYTLAGQAVLVSVGDDATTVNSALSGASVPATATGSGPFVLTATVAGLAGAITYAVASQTLAKDAVAAVITTVQTGVQPTASFTDTGLSGESPYAYSASDTSGTTDSTVGFSDTVGNSSTGGTFTPTAYVTADSPIDVTEQLYDGFGSTFGTPAVHTITVTAPAATNTPTYPIKNCILSPITAPIT